jgi:hypothetical protein
MIQTKVELFVTLARKGPYAFGNCQGGRASYLRIGLVRPNAGGPERGTSLPGLGRLHWLGRLRKPSFKGGLESIEVKRFGQKIVHAGLGACLAVAFEHVGR